MDKYLHENQQPTFTFRAQPILDFLGSWATTEPKNFFPSTKNNISNIFQFLNDCTSAHQTASLTFLFCNLLLRSSQFVYVNTIDLQQVNLCLAGQVSSASAQI